MRYLVSMADDVPQVPDDAEDLDEARLAEIENAAQHTVERLLEIDGAIEQTKRQFGEDLKLDDDFNDRFQEIDRRAEDEKVRREKIRAQEAKKNASIAEDAKGLGVGMTVAYTIIGLPLAGAGIGWLLDREAGGRVFITFGTLLGAALGIAMAVFILNRENNGP